jgi:hypothetical protein
MRPTSTRIALWTTLVTLGIVLAYLASPTVGEDKAAAAKPAAAKEAKEANKPRGRLPNFYRDVVDQKQRETIYKIQEEYGPKIADLRAQLEALTKQRDEKIAAVLTPEQLKKIEDLRAAAKAKREPKTKPAPK